MFENRWEGTMKLQDKNQMSTYSDESPFLKILQVLSSTVSASTYGYCSVLSLASKFAARSTYDCDSDICTELTWSPLASSGPETGAGEIAGTF